MEHQKKLGLISCSFIVAGNMMGSGIAMLPASLADLGSITIFSWILSIVGGVALAFVFAKLSATNPQEGGPVAYAGEVAPILGFQTGVLYFNANWIGNIAVAITGVTYLSTFFPTLASPIPAGITTIIVIWIFTAVNLTGAQWVGRLVTTGVILLLIPVIFTSTVGWVFFKHSLFLQNWNVAHTPDTNTIFTGTLLCIWSFIGVESAAVDANLVKNPTKNIPLATMIGISVAATVYFLSCTAISGMFPHEEVANSGAPFSLAVSHMVGEWARPIVSLIFTFACLTSLSSWMLLVSQAGIKAAKDGTLPAIFADVNKKGIPVYGMIITSIGMSLVMIIFMFSSGSTSKLFSDIISIAVLMTILPYFYSALNLINTGNSSDRQITITLGVILAMAFCIIAYIGAKSYQLLSVTIIALLCMVFYVRKNREDFEKRIYRRVYRWKIDD